MAFIPWNRSIVHYRLESLNTAFSYSISQIKKLICFPESNYSIYSQNLDDMVCNSESISENQIPVQNKKSLIINFFQKSNCSAKFY